MTGRRAKQKRTVKAMTETAKERNRRGAQAKSSAFARRAPGIALQQGLGQPLFLSTPVSQAGRQAECTGP